MGTLSPTLIIPLPPAPGPPPTHRPRHQRQRRRACTGKCHRCSPGLAQCYDHRAAQWYATQVASLVVVPDVHYRSRRREESSGLQVPAISPEDAQCHCIRALQWCATRVLRMYSPLTCIVRLPRHHPRPRDASQVHQCLYVGRAQYHGDRAPQWYATCCAYDSASTSLALTMRSKCINVLTSWPNATGKG